MTEKQPPSYPLRMPQELRERLAEVAKVSGRSMNAEIVARLEASFTQNKLLGVAAFDQSKTLDQSKDLLRATLESRLIQNLIEQSYENSSMQFTADRLAALKDEHSALDRLERRSLKAEQFKAQQRYEALQRAIDEIYRMADRFGVHIDQEELMSADPDSGKQHPFFDETS